MREKNLSKQLNRQTEVYFDYYLHFCPRFRALGKHLTLQLRSLEKYCRAKTFCYAHNSFANTYSSSKRSCSCRCLHPYPHSFLTHVSRSRRFSEQIANRRRSSKTWDYRDSSLPTHGDTPCRARYRVSGILWTRDRALFARFPVYPVQQRFKIPV